MSGPPVSDAPLTDQESLARAAQARLARTVNIAPDFGTPLERGWTLISSALTWRPVRGTVSPPSGF